MTNILFTFSISSSIILGNLCISKKKWGIHIEFKIYFPRSFHAMHLKLFTLFNIPEGCLGNFAFY